MSWPFNIPLCVNPTPQPYLAPSRPNSVLLITMKGFGLDGKTLTGLIALNSSG